MSEAALSVPASRWKTGQSGNPAGRPRSAVDIAALARVHGPRCIEVAVELLDDPDPRIRIATVIALLDRGFGRPAQMIAGPNGETPVILEVHWSRAQNIVSQATINAEPEAGNGTDPAIAWGNDATG